MMGQQAAPARLFYDFCLEDHVPCEHLRELFAAAPQTQPAKAKTVPKARQSKKNQALSTVYFHLINSAS